MTEHNDIQLTHNLYAEIIKQEDVSKTNYDLQIEFSELKTRAAELETLGDLRRLDNVLEKL